MHGFQRKLALFPKSRVGAKDLIIVHIADRCEARRALDESTPVHGKWIDDVYFSWVNGERRCDIFCHSDLEQRTIAEWHHQRGKRQNTRSGYGL
jgi:hypothetical protein